VPKTFRYVVVDCFTDVPLAGNQLAVFTDAREIPEDMLQPLAREMAFSETVFCYPAGWHPPRHEPPPAPSSAGDDLNGDETVFVYQPVAGGHVRIRIFTPVTEVAFAGHPVLGSAFVLAGPLQLLEIRLETGVGIVPVLLEREGDRIVFGRMSQPVPTIAPFERAPGLLAALGVERSELPVELYDNGFPHVYVALAGEQAVSALEPDLAALARLQLGWGGEPFGTSCFAGSGRHWKTRMFAPADGVAEDPATGSAAGPLACHLARHGAVPFGTELVVSQGEELGRPSTLHARAEGSADSIEAVEVGGSAVVVARGEFRL
jgi:trans-2,3-dihydro-3-hydroxyanthranilate isomerase